MFKIIDRQPTTQVVYISIPHFCSFSRRLSSLHSTFPSRVHRRLSNLQFLLFYVLPILFFSSLFFIVPLLIATPSSFLLILTLRFSLSLYQLNSFTSWHNWWIFELVSPSSSPAIFSIRLPANYNVTNNNSKRLLYPPALWLEQCFPRRHKKEVSTSYSTRHK